MISRSVFAFILSALGSAVTAHLSTVNYSDECNAAIVKLHEENPELTETSTAIVAMTSGSECTIEDNNSFLRCETDATNDDATVVIREVCGPIPTAGAVSVSYNIRCNVDYGVSVVNHTGIPQCVPQECESDLSKLELDFGEAVIGNIDCTGSLTITNVAGEVIVKNGERGPGKLILTDYNEGTKVNEANSESSAFGLEAKVAMIFAVAAGLILFR